MPRPDRLRHRNRFLLPDGSSQTQAPRVTEPAASPSGSVGWMSFPEESPRRRSNGRGAPVGPCDGLVGSGLTTPGVYDTVIHMEEVLTIRLPKGTRRRLERRARAQKLSVSQLVRRAIEQDELLTSLASARSELLPQARAQGIYTDEDVFAIVS